MWVGRPTRRDDVGNVAERVVGVGGGAASGGRGGDKAAQVVVGVSRGAIQRVGFGLEIAVGVVGVGGCLACGGGEVEAHRFRRHGAVAVEGEADDGADCVGGQLRPEVRVVGEGADVAEFVGGGGRF